MSEQKRVGIWVRVSSDRQVEGDSPEHHEERARYYAELKGWTVIELYRLDAMSGKSVWDYPDTKRMLKDIKSGHINTLIFSKLARLARNTKELLEFADIFKASKADLVSLGEAIDTSTHIGKFFYTLLAALCEWERAEIVDRVKASVPVRARLGKPLGGAASFGYKWENKELVIDENEAPVRKLLYELFIKHQRKKATATVLNDLGYITRNGSPFSDTTVARLLRDSTAKGERLANYTQTSEKNKNWTLKPKEEWIVVPCPAVVSAELWNECNAILDAQERKRPPGRKAVHLLSGLVKCHCGKTMYVYHKNNIYRCTTCNNRIALTDLDEIYEAHLKEYLQGINVDEYMQQHDEQIQEKKALLETTQKECSKLTRQVYEWIVMRTDGELTKEAFATVYWPAENRLRQLEKTIPALEAEIDVRTIQMMNSDTILTEAKGVYYHWKEVPFEEKRAIVEIVTNEIEVGNNEITINLAHAPPFLNDGKGQHEVALALPFYTYCKIIQKPFAKHYNVHPQTLGEHIRKARIERGLLQADVAKQIGVIEQCITNWEHNRGMPQIHYCPAIIVFLGFYPYDHPLDTARGLIERCRHLLGLSYDQLGKVVGVYGSTLIHWRETNRIVNQDCKEKLLKLIRTSQCLLI